MFISNSKTKPYGYGPRDSIFPLEYRRSLFILLLFPDVLET